MTNENHGFGAFIIGGIIAIIVILIISLCYTHYQPQAVASSIIQAKDDLYNYVISNYHTGDNLNTIVTNGIEKYSSIVPHTSLTGLCVTHATINNGVLSFSYYTDLSHGFRNVIIDNPQTSNNNNIDTFKWL